MQAEPATIDLGTLGLDQGGHLLIKRALRALPSGARLVVRGQAPALETHLRGWCRAQGHTVESDGPGRPTVVVNAGTEASRWHNAEPTGSADRPQAQAQASWGLAGRSATVEAGAPAFDFPLASKSACWADEAGRLYAQALASQWDPSAAIDWQQPVELPDEVEDAVVQIMTYLIENETAALVIPAHFAARVHPHFREVMQLLAIQCADEARHIEVFTRRALLRRPALGRSTVGGQVSLKTLIDEPDFSLSSLLLSVMGEGSFLSLLWFLHQHGPDPLTRQIAKLTAQDEARHVAFGIAHLSTHASEDPSLLDRFAAAIEARHDVLANTAGLNEDVFDALILLAAGGFGNEQIRAGFDAVQTLIADMDRGRVARLQKLGFDKDRARALSSLHTKNFM